MEREMQQEGGGQRNIPQGLDFGAMTAMPVNQFSSGISNSAVVANRSALRTENKSAAAALKAELMGVDSNEATDVPQEPSAPEVPENEDGDERGIKRKASEIEDGDEDVEEEEEDDAPSQTEETDLEAKGKAILDKVAMDKKAADQAAREREPDDAVR